MLYNPKNSLKGCIMVIRKILFCEYIDKYG